jgi:hypothetical protein
MVWEESPGTSPTTTGLQEGKMVLLNNIQNSIFFSLYNPDEN